MDETRWLGLSAPRPLLPSRNWMVVGIGEAIVQEIKQALCKTT